MQAIEVLEVEEFMKALELATDPLVNRNFLPVPAVEQILEISIWDENPPNQARPVTRQNG